MSATMLNRRTLLSGLVASLAMPAVIRTPGLLMPVKTILPSSVWRMILDVDLDEAGLLHVTTWEDGALYSLGVIP